MIGSITPPSAGRTALVVGYGSIGRRHARVLQHLGLAVSVVSRRGEGGNGLPTYRTVSEAAEKVRPDYVVITTETSLHAECLRALAAARCGGMVLVEKPLFAAIPSEDSSGKPNIHVGYQLRFHPAISRLRDLVTTETNVAAQFYVGQHIDGWRPGRSARESYSGHAAAGGGALRDLSHELDLALWLFGRCEQVVSLGGRFTEATVDSDDAWGILARFERCPIVTFQLNYLDLISQRQIVVITNNHTISVDLITGQVGVDGNTSHMPCEGDAAYIAMHRAVIESNGLDACSFEGGMRVVEMIDAIERAARAGTWIVP